MNALLALPLVGFFVGLLIISFGGGGGGIYVGILIVLFHISPAVAASTSLATIVPTAAAGAFSHWKAGNVNLRFGLTMLVGGAAGSVLGSLLSGVFPQRLYNKLTGIIMLALAVQMLFSLWKKKKHSAEMTAEAETSGVRTAKAVLFGLLGGVMAGLVGLSGGGPISAGLMILGCPALETVGTSVLVLLGIAVTGFLAHLGAGNIDWRLVGLLASGTTCGALAGPLLLKHINKKKLEKVLQPVIFLMVVTMGGILMFK